MAYNPGTTESGFNKMCSGYDCSISGSPLEVEKNRPQSTLGLDISTYENLRVRMAPIRSCLSC